jgi:hypothetical protein
MGVNSKGLLSIDPQHIIIPILHCPMGLVDKTLETFKHWVNLEVENYYEDAETENARVIHKLMMQQEEAAIAAHAQAKDVADNCTML